MQNDHKSALETITKDPEPLPDGAFTLPQIADVLMVDVLTADGKGQRLVLTHAGAFGLYAALMRRFDPSLAADKIRPLP